MEEYKSNSHKSKEAPPTRSSEKRNKVVSGNAKQKRKSEPRKFLETFVQDDLTSIGSYIVTDVLVPAIKRTIMDTVKALLGDTGTSSRGSSVGSKVSYRNFYDDRDSGRRTQYSNISSARGFDYDDIIFDTRADADAVLESMLDIVAGQYGMVSVADMYDLANISNDNYTANNYGWTDLRNSKIVATRDGYMIRLPKALPLK